MLDEKLLRNTQNVQFIWDELNVSSTSKEEVVSDMPQMAAIYPEKIDSSADYNEDGSLDIGVTLGIISDKLKIRINKIEFATVIDNGIASTAAPIEMLQVICKSVFMMLHLAIVRIM